MRQPIYDRDTIVNLVAIRKERTSTSRNIKKSLLVYILTLLALLAIAFLVYAWVNSPCQTVDWMVVYITVKGQAHTVTTPEYVPVCIPY